ncbi:nucleotidyltransferase domain-containing protein [Algoriphagus sp. H41]|uniref:Nucleotidyltransferase domain-containing protein n=1 Tax=Algoriphagus oliviformis TaxID=2811231 RepID=A0ABS3BYI3_9BACT|nr:nucleotidyltransferase domain-containing protein [Algoriphagus oliviformis]MBN7809871.1 nucleotidyltransferase domain-containing protein [Algoriphagus oliviformis]
MRKSAILDEITNLAAEKYPNAELVLFGSHATGAARPDSDWDILLLLDQETVDPETEKSIMNDFYELELATGAVISPLIYSKRLWNQSRPVTPLFKSIRKEGILLR